ncbi:hypothetical protein VZT92_013115 [Zoarces viviparus]|uniref:Uncharacterized protein n=1 Tax=Zoarces viviparus TaxID=48416 RepID=A0AAW1F3T7_ZOAVI
MTSTDSAFTKNKDVVESSTTQTKPASTMITGPTVPDLSLIVASTPVTPMKQTSEKFTLMIGGGVTVGVLLLGLALLLNQSRIEKCVSKRPNGLQVDYDETYSMVTYSTNCGTSAAPERDQLHQP